MPRTMSSAAGLAMSLMMAAGTTTAMAADYCTFTSPASHVCPAEVTPPVRVSLNNAPVDHCIALTPASTACPAGPAPVAVATARSVQAQSPAPMQVSRN